MEEDIKNHNFKQKENSKKNKKVVIFLLITLILAIAIVIGIRNHEIISDIANEQLKESKVEEKEETESVNINDIPDSMGNYKVLGVIVIDKLGITKNILNETTDESLNLSVTKFYGPDVNEKGNFCITGHNYKETFAYLNDLELGDTFYIIDKEHSRKITYKIYDKYTVNPTEMESIDQETEGKREVTLITCNPGGITRLIIKSKEV